MSGLVVFTRRGGNVRLRDVEDCPYGCFMAAEGSGATSRTLRYYKGLAVFCLVMTVPCLVLGAWFIADGTDNSGVGWFLMILSAWSLLIGLVVQRMTSRHPERFVATWAEARALPRWRDRNRTRL